MKTSLPVSHAKWIWFESPANADSYGEFYDRFTYSAGSMQLTVSCDTNYAVYVNGMLAAFGQYADFEYFKVADTVELSAYCRPGENHLAIIVWHCGAAGFSTYCPGVAGLLYELQSETAVAAYSSVQTRCRRSHVYRHGQKKIITRQLGYSFDYNAAVEDDWMCGNAPDFHNAISVEKTMELVARPNQKLHLEPRCKSQECPPIAENCRIFDLMQEEVGFLVLDFITENAQTITIAYGEYLKDGRVAQLLGGRDFSVVYRAKAGENQYMNPFRRLGCRYLEVRSEQPIEIRYVGLCPTPYPLQPSSFAPQKPLDRRIYEVCARTLLLCLHEHYEDCPWREQAFYTMDSRNQMLCGYIAFDEFEAARAGLQLFAQDRTSNGLLSICCPMTPDQLQIPSFSLHYFTAIDEYLRFSGDASLGEEVYDKLLSLLHVFASKKENGILPCFGVTRKDGGNAWHFYEWRPHLDGAADSAEPDLLLNCLYISALQHMASIAQMLQRDPTPYLNEAAEMRTRVHQMFYCAEEGLFSVFADQPVFSVTANALAILSGVATESEQAVIAAQLTAENNSLIPPTLSMFCFLYDALLLVDRAQYAPWILTQIRTVYQKMLDQGATTFWEVEDALTEWDGAASRCHGWSALPIYYYWLLQDEANA